MSDQNRVNNNYSNGKICRFSYASWSWCSTDHKESPRRRCRSESLEPCRRKGKEMKTFSPRKYEKNREYENMDLEYETKDFRLDTCRIRSNLCELPTTYIANNCQKLAKVAPDCQNDCCDSSEKSLKIHENSHKSFDVNNQLVNFGNMLEKQEKDKKSIPKDDVHGKSCKSINKITFKVDHVKPHFSPPKSAESARKANTPNGFYTANSEKVLRDFLERAKVLNKTSTQNYQPFKNSKEVYNKLLEAEAKNAHIVNKINLIESFKNPTDNLKRASSYRTIQGCEKPVCYYPKSPSPENQKPPYDRKQNTLQTPTESNQKLPTKTQVENKSFNNLNFGNQKSLFEKQISRFEDLKNQLENQKSLLECQKAYFEQKKNERPSSSPSWLVSPSKTAVKQQPVKVMKTNMGNVEVSVGGTPVSYDTSTYYNNVKDIPNLREKYYREIEMLKTRMNEIRSKSFSSNKIPNERHVNGLVDSNKPGIIIENKESLNGAIKKTNNNISVITKKKEMKSVSKISLKTKKLNNAIKLKKSRAKLINSANLDSDSDCTDSENEAVDITDSVESVDATDSALSIDTYSINNGKGDAENSSWPSRESLFPHIPPYINFNMHNAKPFQLPPGRKYLKWKLTNITPVLVRNTLTNTGFRLIRKSTEWVGTWGKHMKSPMFKTLRDNQKLNHFPGTFQVGRKDRLWRNLQRLMLIYGHKEFGFIPRTYILPQEVKVLKQNWKNGNDTEKWIIKPPASARGTGIRVIHKWSQLPKKSNLIVQRYISNPFLINGSKFDLRLYVLVTSFDPLRIYMYPDGLVRFASVQYSDSNKDLKDRYMHLTNYSINKMSSHYTANDDANSFQGHKWTLSKLWEYLQTRKVDTKGLWRCLQQLVIKTIISGENTIVPLGRENMNNRYNCYELFGVDVLLDNDLNPWLLEVNISPSLHSQSPLDAHVKGPLVQSLFNLAQFHFPAKVLKGSTKVECYNSKLYTIHLLKKERNKHLHFTAMDRREEYLMPILETLTGDDIRHLTQAEDELQVTGNFERIFPTSHTHRYLQYIEPRYYNRLFDAWECRYEKNRKAGIKLLQTLCETKIHLKVAIPPKVVQSSQNIDVNEQQNNQEPSTQPSHNLLNLESSLKEQKETLFNHLLGPNYNHLLPSKEGQSYPTNASTELPVRQLKLNEIKPCVATSVV